VKCSVLSGRSSLYEFLRLDYGPEMLRSSSACSAASAVPNSSHLGLLEIKLASPFQVVYIVFSIHVSINL